MRSFIVKRRINGFMDGLMQGMSASVDAFDTPMIRMGRGRFDGLQHDKSAMVNDVRRVEKELLGTVAQKRQSTAAR